MKKGSQMSQSKKFYITIASVFAVILIVLVSFSMFSSSENNEEAQATTEKGKLAQCLDEKGAVMYGTSWCGHCTDQKNAFGSGKSFLPFVDCEIEGATCKKAGVEAYPTWKFSDGSTLMGNRSLEELAEKTQCEYNLEN